MARGEQLWLKLEAEYTRSNVVNESIHGFYAKASFDQVSNLGQNSSRYQIRWRLHEDDVSDTVMIGIF